MKNLKRRQPANADDESPFSQSNQPAGRKKRKIDSKATKKGAKGGEKATAKKTPAKKVKKPDHRHGNKMFDSQSLFTSDVFRDTQGNANGPAQPNLQSSRRDTALRQLISSLPEDVQRTAKVEKKDLRESIKDFTGQGASVRTDPETGKWKIRGMRTTLEHFQLLGAAFMRRRENDSRPPFGGINADQMGLGKTLMTVRQ